MRISQDMALNGSGNENTNNRPIPTTLRPESPQGGDENALTDVEDLDDSNVPLIRSPTVPVPINSNQFTNTNALNVPDRRRNSDDGGDITDTELMSENEEEPDEEAKYLGMSAEEVDNILRNYGNEGEESIQDNSGDRITTSRHTVSSLSVAGASKANADEDEALTDVEDMEGDGDVDIDIIDTDAPGFNPTDHGCFVELLCGMDLGKDEVRITEIDPQAAARSGQLDRKYSLIEFLQNEDALTELESLASTPTRRLSVDQNAHSQLRHPTPEFPVDPMTDEESIEDGQTKRPYLSLGGPRSITPSDCGDERLYENVTDEEDSDEEAKNKKKASLGNALNVDDIDQGALTDCEDLQDSGDEADLEDEWKPVKPTSDADLDKIFQANVASAQTKISMKNQEPEEPYPETPTDDEEIHCKLIDSQALTPRLVIYNHKDQLAIESEDEGMGGGVTDVEDFCAADDNDSGEPEASSSAQALQSEANVKVIQEILDAHFSSISVRESEILENGESRRNSKGPDTETEELMDTSVKKKSITCIPEIIIPEGSEASSSGGNLIRRRGKKKQARRSIFFNCFSHNKFEFALKNQYNDYFIECCILVFIFDLCCIFRCCYNYHYDYH